MHRDTPLELIGLSETALRDCVPHLDVGDSFAVLGAPSLASEFDDAGDPQPSDISEAVAARQDLIDVLSGHCVLMSPVEEDAIGDSAEHTKVPFAPWSLRYSGHQFGSFAGQLGDGRAISIRTVSFVCCFHSRLTRLHMQMSQHTHHFPIRPTSSSLKAPAAPPFLAPPMV